MKSREIVTTMIALSWAPAFAWGGGGGDAWVRDGKATLERAKKIAPINRPAKNVILFLGDGMGVSTITAARILEGQQRGKTGEENLLSFERFPYSAMIKTYNTNQQTPDSAGTMSAIMTGVKTKAGVLSLDEDAVPGDWSNIKEHKRKTVLELAEESGRSTGVVSTAPVTHATPGACYAHTPDRDWEYDRKIPVAEREKGAVDIARQLIDFPLGDGLDVVLGGGRSYFLPHTVSDPEDHEKGLRLDGPDLTAEWLKKPRSKYVWSRSQFESVDVSQVDHLLGLFNPEDMEYEHDRTNDIGGEPSLTEMTIKAIDLLKRNDKGFFLMVEGGRIDHGHHAGNAFRALTETIEFAKAIEAAVQRTDRNESLIVVTADHSHMFAFGGYATRGNPVLGKVILNDDRGEPAKSPAKDGLGLPYTSVGYMNGPGYSGASRSQPEGSKRYPHDGKEFQPIKLGRPNLEQVNTTSPDFLPECAVPLRSETHGGEDVVVFADGPMAHLLHGVQEQNYIFYVMADALGVLP